MFAVLQFPLRDVSLYQVYHMKELSVEGVPQLLFIMYNVCVYLQCEM